MSILKLAFPKLICESESNIYLKYFMKWIFWIDNLKNRHRNRELIPFSCVQRCKSDQTGLGCKARTFLDRKTGAGLGETKQPFFSVMGDVTWRINCWDNILLGEWKQVYLALDEQCKVHEAEFWAKRTKTLLLALMRTGFTLVFKIINCSKCN